jgi:Ribonuclease G/E
VAAQAESVTTEVPSRFRTVSRVLHVLVQSQQTSKAIFVAGKSCFLMREGSILLPALSDPVREEITRIAILASLCSNGDSRKQALRRGG